MIDWIRFRHFRYETPLGFFKKIRDKFYSFDSVLSYLNEVGYKNAYYSIACYLNPEKVASRKEDFNKTYFLFADLLFDIDAEKITEEKLEEARLEALKVLDFVEERGIKIKYIAFSGAKGFHIVAEDFERDEGLPLEREEKARKRRERLAEEMKEKNLKIDYPVFTDTRRIVRIPFTVNSKTGLIALPLSKREIEKPIKEILDKVKRASPSRKAMTPPSGKTTTRGDRREVRSPLYSFFITSNILGTKAQIPILELPIMPKGKIERKLREIQEIYNLTKFFVFRDYKKIYAFTLDIRQERRIKKILKAGNCLNYASYIKYHHALLRKGIVFDEQGNEVFPEPKFWFEVGDELPKVLPVHAELVGMEGKVGEGLEIKLFRVE